MTPEQKLDAILTMLVRIDRKLGSAPPQPREVEIATDAELDSASGDEEVKKNPKRWKGEDFAGKRMSETSPEYLDEVASFNVWAAGMSEAKAKDKEREGDNVGAQKERTNAQYRRASARRARGWAARLRAKQTTEDNW